MFNAARPGRRGMAGMLAVTAVAACSLAACGGSSTSSAPSRATYARQASSICSSYNGQLQTIGNQLSNAQGQEAVESALQQAINVGQQETNKLNGLQKPSGDHSAVNTAIGSLQSQVNDLKSVLTAVQNNDQSGTQAAATKFESDNGSVNKAFDNAGLPACGSGGSA